MQKIHLIPLFLSCMKRRETKKSLCFKSAFISRKTPEKSGDDKEKAQQQDGTV